MKSLSFLFSGHFRAKPPGRFSIPDAGSERRNGTVESGDTGGRTLLVLRASTKRAHPFSHRRNCPAVKPAPYTHAPGIFKRGTETDDAARLEISDPRGFAGTL
jgi:hypothetical protein